MTSERDLSDHPFYGLGYTDPDTAEELHVRKLDKQKIPREKREPRRIPRGNTRDFESDPDHEREDLTMDEVRELRERPLVNPDTIAAARAALERTQYESDLAETGEEKTANLRRLARAAKRAQIPHR